MIANREFGRWYPLKDHPVQLDLMRAVGNGVRFPVVPAGRRSGKTERFKRFVSGEAMKYPGEMYFAGAPTRDQAKKIFWNDLKLLTFANALPKKPSETDLKIFLPNDTTITVLGLDEPARFEGIPWTGGGIDEFGNIKEGAWEENIMPALDTVDPRRPNYRAWCWIFGVPEGLNHYYDRYDYARTSNDPLWKVFHWKSSEILPPDVIESAKRILSPRQFRQEYEACHLPDTKVPLYGGGFKRISELSMGDVVIHVNEHGDRSPVEVIAGGKTKVKQILSVTLETGDKLQASDNHKFKVDCAKVELKNAEFLNAYHVPYLPLTRDEKMASLVGYNIGDGTGTNKTNGSLSCCFYGGKSEMQQISDNLHSVFGKNYKVGFKRGRNGQPDIWQVQVGGDDARELVDKGCVLGKKVSKTFDIPAWIMRSDLNVKRAFVAALFGAEGSKPRPAYKQPAMPVLTMHKADNNSFVKFFSELSLILGELGIKSVIKTRKSTTGLASALYVCSGMDNIKRFYESCGYLYSEKKAELAWLWSKYLSSAAYHSMKTRELAENCVALHGFGNEAKKISGMSAGRLWRLTRAEKKIETIFHDFPSFNDWVGARKIGNSLRINIVSKEIVGETQMYNIKVSSHDHSYLVADGFDNYNSFESAEGKIYEDYSHENTTQEQIESHEQLMWHHDFNFTPMSSGIAVRRGNIIYILDEIILSSATSRQSAIEFCERYKNHQNKHVVIYGDPAGRAGEKHGHASDYTEMENYLRSKGWSLTRKVKSAAPSIKDRQNAVRAKILNAAGERSLFVNPLKCPYSHKGLATVQFKKGSSFLEEDSDYQHITTAIGYMIDYEFPVYGESSQIKLGGFL